MRPTSETATETTEILVHITAPSRASDDVKYRALAAAYLAFEPTRIVELPKAPTDSSQRSLEALISPQASFSSVWDNVNSPTLATRKGQSGLHSTTQLLSQDTSQKCDETQNSWIAPPSEVPDSMPDNDISVAAFCTPTRVLNYYLQTAGPPSSSPDNSSSRVSGSGRNAFDGTLPPEAYDTVVFSGETSRCPSESVNKRPRHVGNTPEPAEPSPEESRVLQTPPSPFQQPKSGVTPVDGLLPVVTNAALESIQAAQLSREDIIGTTIIPFTQVLERAESEPPSVKRRRKGPAEKDAQALSRSVSDLLPRGSGQGTDLQQVSQQESDAVLENPDWSHATQILSIEPIVANHSLGPRPPVILERLAEDMEIKRRYQPRYQAREMRPYERGYWLVKLDGWDHHEKVAFWGFLGNWISRDGNAGWGTRACRDESWNWVRLYGWEHIAGELYILLYVASYRLLKCMEMKFYDGTGNVLVVVGARSDRRRLV